MPATTLPSSARLAGRLRDERMMLVSISPGQTTETPTLAAPVTTATRPRKFFTSASPDHAGVTQRSHGLRGHAEQLTQHLLRVFAQHRGRCAYRARRLGQANRGTHHLHLARTWMLHLHEGAARLHLRMRD